MSMPPQGASPEAPKPMPFAIMRNSHEALRASIHLQSQALDAGDVDAFRAEWARFGRALAVHKAMEDDAMFALLDEVSGGAVSEAALPAEHDHDLALARRVDAALTGGSDGLRAAWDAWRVDHLHHLEHEERVMMPLTMKTGATPDARARVVQERLLRPSLEIADFDWYVGWVVAMLDAHGSSGQPASVAVRVFAWGLQASCTPEQWDHFRPIVSQNCSPAIWGELSQKFGLDGPGMVA